MNSDAQQLVTSPTRSAFAHLELIAAAMVLSVAFVLLTPSIASVQTASQDQSRVALATEEVRNVLERAIAEHTVGRFDATSLDQLQLRPDLASVLKDADWAYQLEDTAESPAGQRLTLSLTYGTRRVRTVSLSAWLWETPQ